MGVELKSVPTSDKLRGGYYTPEALADWLAAHLAEGIPQSVFEPSCGDGELLAAVSRHIPDAAICGVELDPIEAERAAARLGDLASVHTGDVFAWLADEWDGTLFDSVIGNPPFIRYQNFPESYRDRAMSLMRAEGLSPNKLTNAWVPFVVLATKVLRPGGRLALVLPAELMQVSYAAELREFLVTAYTDLTLVTFERIVFPGIQQEIVLLLGERAMPRATVIAGISTIDVRTAEELPAPNASLPKARVAFDHTRDKWTRYLLSPADVEFLAEVEQHPGLKRLSDLAEVDVGLVTGRNEFFVLKPSKAQELGLEDEVIRMVGRSAQIPGLTLSEDEWFDLYEKDGLCLLLDLGSIPKDELSEAAQRYVETGEEAGFHTGYKCRIRLPNWWRMPGPWAPDAFMLRQIHDGPRVIVNSAGATCTDTVHRLTAHENVDVNELAAVFNNSLTWAFAEVFGRSYGGGVLELEPTEAEALLVPFFTDGLDLQALDSLRRAKGSGAVLDEVDAFALEGLGMGHADRKRLRMIWEQLSSRRSNRGPT